MALIKHLKVGFNKFLCDFEKAKVNNSKFIITLVVVIKKPSTFGSILLMEINMNVWMNEYVNSNLFQLQKNKVVPQKYWILRDF